MNHEPWLEDSLHGLPCRVLLPEAYAPQTTRYPLVVCLHGSGERGTDNTAQLRNGLDAFVRTRTIRPCIVVAPQLPPGETWGGSWYGGETAGQRTLVALTQELSARRSVDPRRVYGVGFSMGAIGLWDILTRHPDLFAASVLIAGDLDVAAASPLVDVPLWAVHGGRDTLVLPHNPRAFAALARARGGRAKYTEVDDVGHEVWRFAFAHEPLWAWLFAQSRAAP
jgi:predicted peptidase